MKSFRLEAPAFQNWSCHGCTNCCRDEMLVAISDAEKRRIESQGWSRAEGVDPSKMIVTSGNESWLGHQGDGSCVFLDEAGRCRIHSRFGENAKPLACRLYPLALHPAGKKLVIGLRFSCPSAVANHGKPLTTQVAEWRKLAEELVPDRAAEIPPPPLLDAAGLEWPDFLRVVAWLDAAFANDGVPLPLRFLRALHQLQALEKAQFGQIRGREADEILAALSRTAVARVSQVPEIFPEPGRLARFFFRLLILEYGRRDSAKDLHARHRHRWNILRALAGLGRGSHTPTLRPELRRVPIAAIEQSFGALPSEAEAMLTRFFRVKIQSLHFCGRACYDLPLAEGFYTLALLYPVILWLARWIAVGEERSTLTVADVSRAIALADLHYGYSPRIGSFGFRWLTRNLARRDDIARLCRRYSR